MEWATIAGNVPAASGNYLVFGRAGYGVETVHLATFIARTGGFTAMDAGGGFQEIVVSMIIPQAVPSPSATQVRPSFNAYGR